MDVMGWIQGLIDQFGLLAALLAFAGVNYVLITRSSHKADDKARNAATAQQQAITEQFTVLAVENRRLQSRVDTLEAAQVIQAASGLAQEKELKQAQERAGRLEIEVKTLTEKVAALETEKTVRAGELERERRQGETLNRSLLAANEQIAQLRDRVSKLEGENTALRLILEKIQVVKVDPEPDPPPNPPPPVALHVEPHKREGAA